MMPPDKNLAAYPLGWFYAQHHHTAVQHRSGIVTDHSAIVTAYSGKPENSVTFDRNHRSRSIGIIGHVRPESPVTLLRNTHGVN
jgi:hypothetical protein